MLPVPSLLLSLRLLRLLRLLWLLRRWGRGLSEARVFLGGHLGDPAGERHKREEPRGEEETVSVAHIREDLALVVEVVVAILTALMASHPTATLGGSPSESPDSTQANQSGEAQSRAASGEPRRRAQGMEVEMNRFHAALREVRHDLRDARRGAVASGTEEDELAFSEEDSLLRDSLVLLEVERTILDDRLSAENALSKVLEERVRLARLLAGDPAIREVAVLGRAFRRVVEALLAQGVEESFPNGRSSTSSPR